MIIAPRLARTHLGYFRVTVMMILLHLGHFFDFALTDPRRHTAPVFASVAQALHNIVGWTGISPLPFLGWAHLVLGLAMVAGMYKSHSWVRWSYRLSTSIFALQCFAFLGAAVTNPLASTLGFVNYLFITGICLAGALEPPSVLRLDASTIPTIPTIPTTHSKPDPHSSTAPSATRHLHRVT